MSDPPRLADSNDAFTRELMWSVSEDEPPRGALGRAAIAIGVGSAVAGAAANASAATTAVAAVKVGAAASTAAKVGTAASGIGAAGSVGIPMLMVAKFVGIGAIAGLVTVGGMQVVQRAAESSHRMQTAASATAAPSGGGMQSTPAVATALPRASASADEEPGAGTSAVPVAAPSQMQRGEDTDESEPGVADAAGGGPSLTAEVAALDRAREALAAGRGAEVLRELDSYERGVRTGVLDPEATVLRIDALQQVGNRAAAAELARKFVATHPSSAHAPRLRAMIEAAPRR